MLRQAVTKSKQILKFTTDKLNYQILCTWFFSNPKSWLDIVFHSDPYYQDTWPCAMWPGAQNTYMLTEILPISLSHLLKTIQLNYVMLYIYTTSHARFAQAVCEIFILKNCLFSTQKQSSALISFRFGAHIEVPNLKEALYVYQIWRKSKQKIALVWFYIIIH